MSPLMFLPSEAEFIAELQCPLSACVDEGFNREVMTFLDDFHGDPAYDEMPF